MGTSGGLSLKFKGGKFFKPHKGSCVKAIRGNFNQGKVFKKGQIKKTGGQTTLFPPCKAATDGHTIR